MGNEIGSEWNKFFFLKWRERVKLMLLLLGRPKLNYCLYYYYSDLITINTLKCVIHSFIHSHHSSRCLGIQICARMSPVWVRPICQLPKWDSVSPQFTILGFSLNGNAKAWLGEQCLCGNIGYEPKNFEVQPCPSIDSWWWWWWWCGINVWWTNKPHTGIPLENNRSSQREGWWKELQSK